MTRITSSGKNTWSSNVTEVSRITRSRQTCTVHQHSLRSNKKFKNGSVNMLQVGDLWLAQQGCFLHCYTEQHCYWFLIFWRIVLEHSLTLLHEGSALSRMAPNLWHCEECTTFITLNIINTATQHYPEDLNLQDLHFLGDCFDLMTENSTPRFS
jgi:hypothetical protein